MANLTGISGLVKIGTALDILAATHNAGTVTIQTDGNHGKAAGDRIFIQGVVGMTDLNGYHTVASSVDADEFTITLTTAQTYTSGGTVVRHVPVISWNANGGVEVIPASDSESGSWEENIAGRKTWDIQFEGYAKEGASIPVEGDSL